MYNLSDELIAHVARQVQIAILTGTDIVDNLRMIQVCPDEDGENLVLTDEYRLISESQIQSLVSEIEANLETD